MNKLHEDVKEVLAQIELLFGAKNEQYRTDGDDFANFTTGAMLRYGKADMPARFEALKDYVSRHIAKAYNGRLGDEKMDESIMDIAVYFVIAMVMHKRMKNENLTPKKLIQEAYWLDNGVVKNCSKCGGAVNVSSLYKHCPHCGAFTNKKVEYANK